MVLFETVTSDCNMSDVLKIPQEDFEITGSLSYLALSRLQIEFQKMENIGAHCYKASVKYCKPVMTMEFICKQSDERPQSIWFIWNATIVRPTFKLNDRTKHGLFLFDACNTQNDANGSLAIRYNSDKNVWDNSNPLISYYGLKCACNVEMFLKIYYADRKSFPRKQYGKVNNTRYYWMLAIVTVIVMILVIYAGYIKIKPNFA